MKMLRHRRAAWIALSLAAFVGVQSHNAFAADITLTIASMNDPFAAAMAKLADRAKKDTGIGIKVDIMDYGELMTKTTADFVGHTAGYDISTMDNVMSGQYATGGHVIPLDALIARDKEVLSSKVKKKIFT